MPTPTGKPKIGERVLFRGFDGSIEQRGVVLERTAGTLWSLRVRWDEVEYESQRETLVLTCDWLMGRGLLEIIDD